MIAAYLAGITLFGLRFRKRQRTLRDYFLADRSAPWWAIALSIVATETSTLTIVSVPGLAFDTDLTFLQVVFGYMAGRVVITLVLLPHYFRGELFTAYELMQRRFGGRLRSLSAGIFLLTRAAADGVRFWAVALVVGIGIQPLTAGLSADARDLLALTIIAALTLLYTFEGGLAAVIWTDVVQLFVYLTGAVAAFVTILVMLPGGWSEVAVAASAAGKFRVFDFSFSASIPYTFWAGLIGGAFLTTASHGTDQLMVQRLLAARSERHAGTALLASGGLVLLQFALFLLLGLALFAFYRAFPPAMAFARADAIFPTFIVERMPHGLAGLMIAAILAAAMSTLSSSLNSLSSSSVVDFYLRLRPHASEQQRMWLSRAATVGWAAVLFALAVVSRRGERVLEMGLAIASVTYGALLGVFLLGVLTRRANERGAMAGMGAGFATSLYVWQATRIPWTWYVLIGTAVTFAVGYIASLAFPPRREEANG